MRTTFIKTLIELARQDKDIFLLTGDLGFSVLEEFRDEFPERFINMGVAEQNMIGVAAGLALCGKKVYVYSIIPFITMRCFEQVRNDLCYQDLPVKLIGVGSGISYGSAGPTHHAIEDISIMRSLPNMTVICPCDPIETREAVKASLNIKNPIYIRLARSGEPVLHKKNIKFEIGKCIKMREGSDITFIATGNMVETAINLSEKLGKEGISVRVISMHTLKPIDKEIIIATANETKAIFTLEEHSCIGGLGSAVADVLAKENIDVCFTKISLPDEFIHQVGCATYLREELGISADKILEKIKTRLRELNK